MHERLLENIRRCDRGRPRLRPIVLAVGLALAGQAAAQTAPAGAADVTLERVVVVGQAEATDRALNDQERADDIRSVVRSDGIGRLPDKNAAEALQRLPGVSVERDQGEGRYVRVRGLGPDLNAVTVNGALLPSPERDRRAVMLDVLPSSLIGALEVVKTLTPDMDANSIGGTVNIKTLSAFDVKGRLLSLDAGVGRDDNTDRTSPSAALVWADRYAGGKLGVSLGLNLERRRFGSDNVETGGAWDDDLLEEFERRDYRITRERAGAALNLEYRPAAGTEYYLRSMVSRYTDEERRLAHVVEFADAQASGAAGEAESVRELKDRKETQRISSVALGLSQRLASWRLAAEAATSRASERTPQHTAAAVFEGGDFDGVGYTDSRRPVLAGPASINSADPYELTEIEVERTLYKDRINGLRLDAARELELLDAPAELKFGAKASRRKRSSEQTTWVLEDFEDEPFSLSGAQLGLGGYAGASPDYPLGSFGPSIGTGAVRGIYAGRDLSSFVDDEESTINDYRMKENIDAAYGQLRFELADWRLIGGLRMERTRFRADGTGVEDGDFVPTSTSRSYRHWLPGLHARKPLDETTVLRAAWTHSVVRPAFEQVAPGYVIEDDEAEFGNPSLRPLKSRNLDLGVERRLGYAGVLSAYGFHKRIKDFAYQTDVAGTGRWADFSEAVTFDNGERATVYGVELAYSQSFRGLLPAPWNNLLFGANVTYSRSRATIARFDADAGAMQSRRIPLPSQSDWLVNLVLGYETEGWSARVALNHKSRYLLEVGDVLDASGDLYVDAQTQVDLALRLKPTRALQLSFEVLNLNDESYYVYAGSRARNAQWETYGRTYRIAVNYSFN